MFEASFCPTMAYSWDKSIHICMKKSPLNFTERKTPCVNICKYDKNFMDGFVCIGCFREQYEITNWSKLSSKEKAIIYQDITSRMSEYKKFQNSQQYKQ